MIMLCPRERKARKLPGYDSRLWEEHGCMCGVCTTVMLACIPLMVIAAVIGGMLNTE